MEEYSCPICYGEGRDHLIKGHELFIVHLLGHLNDLLEWDGSKWLPKEAE